MTVSALDSSSPKRIPKYRLTLTLCLDRYVMTGSLIICEWEFLT